MCKSNCRLTPIHQKWTGVRGLSDADSRDYAPLLPERAARHKR